MTRDYSLSRHLSRRDVLASGTQVGAAALAISALGHMTTRPASARAQGEPVTLEFWNTFSSAEVNLLHQMGAEYMELNPNIRINFLEIPNDQRTTKVPTAVETDSLPDILRADHPYQWYLSEVDKLAVLDEYLTGWEMRDAIFDLNWQEVTFEGKIIGIPQDQFTSVYCYNKDKFARDGVGAFPTTWDELVEACRKMTHDDEYGIAYPFGNGIYRPLWSLILQAGGQVFDENENPVMNSEEGVTALQFAVDLVNDHKVMPPGVANFGYADVDNALRSGKLGMAVFGSYQIANYREAGVPWELGIAPQTTGPAGPGTLSATSFYVVMNTSGHQQEAVELLKWLVSRENALRWAKSLDHEPIDDFTAADPYFQQPIFQAFADSRPFAQPRPAIPRFLAIATAFDVAGQKAVLGQASAKEALDELVKETELILDRS